DAEHQILPDAITLPGIAAGLLAAGLRAWLFPGGEAPRAIVLGHLIGAFLGLRLMLFTLFAGAVVGAAWGVYLIAFHGYGWRSKLPYGVFLGGAAIVALFVGEPAVRWYALQLGGPP